MSGFEPGQLVECINDGSHIGAFYGIPTPLRLRAVYTITSSRPHEVHPIYRLTLREVKPPGSFHDFGSDLFRPLPDERLDQFRALLEPKPEEVVAYEIADNIDRTEEVARAMGTWAA